MVSILMTLLEVMMMIVVIGGDPVENGEEGDPVLPDLHEDEEVNEDEELDEDAVMKEFVLDAMLRLVEIKGEAGFSL